MSNYLNLSDYILTDAEKTETSSVDKTYYYFSSFNYYLGTQQIKDLNSDKDCFIEICLVKNILPYSGTNETNSGVLSFQKLTEDTFPNTTLGAISTIINPNKEVDFSNQFIYPTGKKIPKEEFFNIETFNKHTNISSEYSYQSLKNIPASSTLYGDEKLSKNNFIKNDRLYQDWISSYSETEDYQAYVWSAIKLKYDFDVKYNESEYRYYGVDQEPIIENKIDLIPSNVDLKDIDNKDIKDIFKYGIDGILFLYGDNEHKDDDRIPISYQKFRNKIFSNNFEINFNSDGLISVE